MSDTPVRYPDLCGAWTWDSGLAQDALDSTLTGFDAAGDGVGQPTRFTCAGGIAFVPFVCGNTQSPPDRFHASWTWDTTTFLTLDTDLVTETLDDV